MNFPANLKPFKNLFDAENGLAHSNFEVFKMG
jgi:hypothetical protein